VVGEETRSLDCDIMLKRVEVGKWRYCEEGSVDGVAANIGEGGFGVLLAGEVRLRNRSMDWSTTTWSTTHLQFTSHCR
jgi:hypothetical protein